MKHSENTYSAKIEQRIRALWLVLILMLVYMVVVGETGGGDSRMQTQLAKTVTTLIFFGGMAYVIARIVHNKKLLKSRAMMRRQQLEETDERNQYLHDKSGGFVMDLLLLAELFITTTAGMYNMAAFYTALAVLLCTLVLKLGSYWYFSRN